MPCSPFLCRRKAQHAQFTSGRFCSEELVPHPRGHICACLAGPGRSCPPAVLWPCQDLCARSQGRALPKTTHGHPSRALTFANGASPPSLLAFRSQCHVMTLSAAPCQRLPLPITHGCCSARSGGSLLLLGRMAAGSGDAAPSSPPLLPRGASPSTTQGSGSLPPGCWRRLAFQNHY